MKDELIEEFEKAQLNIFILSETEKEARITKNVT